MPRRQRRITASSAPLFRRFPALQRAMRAGDLLGARGVRDPDAARRLRAGCCGGSAWRTCERSVADPELRAKLTPDYLLGCKRILVSNDYLPGARPSRTSRSSPRGSPRSAAAPWSAPTAASARSTRSSAAPASTSPTCRSPSGSRRRRPLARRALGRQPAGPPRDDGRRLPEPLPAARAQHRARPQLGRLHGRGAGRLRRAGARAHARAPSSRRSRSRAEAQRAWNDAIQARMDGTVWLEGGCASWYLDAQRPQHHAVARLQLRFARALRRFEPAEHIGAPRVDAVRATSSA